MIEPVPCARIWRPACLVARKAPIRLTRSTSCHWATVWSNRETLPTQVAALAKKTSRPPNSSMQRETMASTSASTAASAAIAKALPPAARIRSAVSSNLVVVRPVTSTWAPSWAKRRALARPMPLPAPVMITRLLCNRCITLSSWADKDTNSGACDGQAAIGHDQGTVDVAAVRRGEEGHRRGNFAGVAKAADGYVLLSGVQGGLVEFSQRGRCADHAGRDGVHPDAIGAEIECRGSRQARYRRLDGAVGDGVLERQNGGRGAEVDDCPGAASLHLRRRGLGCPDDAFQAHGEHLLQGFFVDLFDRLIARPDGVVYERRQRPAKVGFDVLEYFMHLAAPSDIDHISVNVQAVGAHLRDGRLEARWADVEAGNTDAFAGKAFGDGAADSPSRSGHDRDGSLQSSLVVRHARTPN